MFSPFDKGLHIEEDIGTKDFSDRSLQGNQLHLTL
jgi:hypothetical protein